MDLNKISKLLSLHSNNAEVITPDAVDLLNVTLYEMPDVLAYDKSVNRMYVITATNLKSRNTKVYVDTMESQFSQCKIERVYIFVYQNRSEYAKMANELVWGTHIWCVEEPDHMIHLH